MSFKLALHFAKNSITETKHKSPRSSLFIFFFRRIYTTFILGTALQNFGTRANSFGHGPLHLHGKICSRFFNVDFWYGTPETRTALLICASLRLYDSGSHLKRVSGALLRAVKRKQDRFSSAKSNCMARCFEKVKTSVTIESRIILILCTALTFI